MIVIDTPKEASLNTKYGLINVFKGDDPIGTCLHLYGEWADQEFDVIDKLVTEESCCIDLGANVGTHTVWLAQRCNKNFIFSFEPQFYIFLLLNSNIVMNNCFNVVPIRSFVADRNDFIKTVIHTPNYEKFNYGEFNINSVDETSNLSTQIMRLDDVDFLGKTIDFIKMDCEGTEVQVIESGKQLLTRDKPHMYIEFNGIEGNDLVLKAIKDLDYNCYWHVYPKFNTNNHNKHNENIWVYSHIKCNQENIPKFYESNMICIHKEKDDGRFKDFEQIELGDGLKKYVIRHGLLEE